MRTPFSLLSRYLFSTFIRSILTVFAITSFLIYVLDIIELTRISNDASLGALFGAAKLSLLRTPVVAEQVLPFAGLFGALFAFLSLARSRELVIARAAGMSVWHFISAPLAAALFIGAAATLVLNPMSSVMKAMADDASSAAIDKASRDHGKSVWIRQKSVDGEAILRANAVDAGASQFEAITAFEFDLHGVFVHRIEARTAKLMDGYWLMSGARLLTPGAPPDYHATYELPTYLTAGQIRQSLSDPESISFYDLPAWARATEAAGLDSSRYFQQYYTLLARPVLMAAMLMLAATVTLRFSRTGAQVTSILGAIGAGFALYVSNKVMADLGSAGMLSPSLTSFICPVIAGLLCALVLLYQEDG
jgi:lipopolysaccharide export system permease protein